MDWLKDYRTFIQNESSRLRLTGLSFLGEDDTSMTFMDNKVCITFSVEPFSEESISVQVEYLSDDVPDHQIYFLDVLIGLAISQGVWVGKQKADPADHESVVRSYVDFVVDNRGSLFQSVCPLAREYAKAAQASEDAVLLELEGIRKNYKK